MAQIYARKDFFMSKEYVKKVTVTSAGEFRAWLPAEVAEEMDTKYVTADTLGDAENERDAVLKEFEELRKKKRRVIAVEFKVTENTLVNIQDVANIYATQSRFGSTMSFSSGHGFCLSVCEYIEEEATPPNGEKYYKYHKADKQPYPRGSVDSSIITGWKHDKQAMVHEWSQELEDMLCDILQKTVDLAKRLQQLTHSSNIEKAALEYSSNKLLGPVNTEEEDDYQEDN